MDISIGNIAHLRSEFLDSLGSKDKDGRFLVTLVTDHAVALKGIREGERYTVRIKEFVNNLKWFEHPYVPSPVNIQPVEAKQQPPPPPPPPPPDQPYEVSYIAEGGLEFSILYVPGIVEINDTDPYNGGDDPYG